jgi:hypothetical protein
VQRGRVELGEVEQLDEPRLTLDERANRRAVVRPDDQVALRKTVGGPGGSGVAEVALRSGR